MKMRFFFLPSIVVFSLLLLGCTSSSQKEKYVVVLSLDGFSPDYLDKAHTPTLDSLAKVGVRSTLRPCFPSVTFPNHYSLGTGLHPDHHGLVNNTFYDADFNAIYRIADRRAVQNPDFYLGEPIWNTAEKQGIRAASYFWVGSEAPVQDMQPSIWKKFDSSVPYKDRADSVVAWLRLPEDIRPHLIMWYIEEPDAAGHNYTPDSAATYRMVEHLDSVLHYFFNEARKLEQFEQIDFIVLSDHGMATYVPEKYVNLNDYLPIDSFNYVFEGVPLFLYPKETYLETAYEKLQNVPNIKVYKKENMPEKYVYGTNSRIGDLVVLPNIGTYAHFRAESAPKLGGAHGYDNFAPEMEAIFFAAGPSFKEGAVFPVMANVNIYPLIAHILNLKPAKNDGDIELVKKLLKEEK
ncbi:MAG: ectonucleotide pyrophosphatase/phosphodiesterase [Prevotellaceae bacterium]|nr:ectonucleotide pyrophosphatase/phosphodiesterase [Prevotellaceae bacterium]